jgi:hypothetical protein
VATVNLSATVSGVWNDSLPSVFPLGREVLLLAATVVPRIGLGRTTPPAFADVWIGSVLLRTTGGLWNDSWPLGFRLRSNVFLLVPEGAPATVFVFSTGVAVPDTWSWVTRVGTCGRVERVFGTLTVEPCFGIG